MDNDAYRGLLVLISMIFRKFSNEGMIDPICLNLRLMLAVIDRSKTISNEKGGWAVVTLRVSDKHKLSIEAFLLTNKALPVARWSYVTVESDEVSTISGPPSTLARYFFYNDSLRKPTRIDTPIKAAFYAKHL